MVSNLIFFFCFFIVGVWSIPGKLGKRDPCDGVNASPVLYHEYGVADCPPKSNLGSDGRCIGYDSVLTACSTFCQIRTNFEFTTEVPFDNTYCHGPLTCTITTTNTKTFMIPVNINLKFLEAWGIGVSGGYSSQTADAVASAFQIKLEAGQCGYFTFVPIRKQSCGTYTSMLQSPVPGGSFCVGDVTNEGNVCGDQPKLNSQGKADGDTIFVRTDCSTRIPLDMDQQDPVYQKPGVPLDRGTLMNLLNSWETDSCDVSYEVLLDSFTIKGKDWTDNELGANGDGLKQQIEGCGALTAWNFEWTPDDGTYDWKASGNLPIGVKACVGRAVTTAGGPNAKVDGCHGAG